MATCDYSRDVPKKCESFGQLVARIINTPASSMKDFAATVAQDFCYAKARVRVDSPKGKDSRRYYNSN